MSTTQILSRILIAALIVSALAVGAIHSASAQEMPNEVIVRFRPAVDGQSIIESTGDQVIAKLHGPPAFLVGFARFATVGEAVASYEAMPEVAYAEANEIVYLPQTHQISHPFLDPLSEAFEEDISPTAFYAQSAVDQIGLDSAHQLATGFGVLVSVIDNGVDSKHVLLADRLSHEGYDFLDLDSKADPEPGEVESHGTFIAGIVALAAPEATILPVRAFDGDGAGTAFAVAAGIEYSIEKSAHVINLSFGMTVQDSVIAEVLRLAADSGIAVVASAGNDNLMSPVPFPASDPTTLAIAAVDSVNVKTIFSNFGPFVSASAPGLDLYGPLVGEDTWGRWQGTSFAAAFASGLLALQIQSCPDAPTEWYTSSVLDGCVDISLENPEFTDYLGSGLIDGPASLTALPPEGCDCILWGDVDFNGKVDQRDLTEVTDYVYRGHNQYSNPLPPDWDYSHDRGDVDCSGGTPNPADIVRYAQAIYHHAYQWPLKGCE